MLTRSTVPGQIVIKVFITKRVSKFILFNAPMLLLLASVKSLLCKSITLAMRYSLRNIGKERRMSMLTSSDNSTMPSWCIVFQVNWKSPGIGCIAHTTSSTHNWAILLGEMATRQSSTQLSTAKSWKICKQH